MKRILVVALVIVCGIVYSNVVAQTMAELDGLREENGAKPDTQPMGIIDLEIPCMDESFDTEKEVRALGVGEGRTPAQAKNNALHAALDEIIWKMPMQMKTVVTFNPDGSSTDETITESLLTEEQKQVIFSNARIYCLKYENVKEGGYVAYMVVSVPKEKTKF